MILAPLGNGRTVAILPFLIHHDQMAEHLVVQAQKLVKFGYRRTGALEPEEHVVATGFVFDFVGKTTHSPVVFLGDFAVVRTEDLLDTRNTCFHLSLRQLGLENENKLVLFH